jgi:hypothetical protein
MNPNDCERTAHRTALKQKLGFIILSAKRHRLFGLATWECPKRQTVSQILLFHSVATPCHGKMGGTVWQFLTKAQKPDNTKGQKPILLANTPTEFAFFHRFSDITRNAHQKPPTDQRLLEKGFEKLSLRGRSARKLNFPDRL